MLTYGNMWRKEEIDMCTLVKERIESEAMKKGTTMEAINTLYPGLFESNTVSIDTVKSLASMLNCNPDYILGKDLNQNITQETNDKFVISHLDKAMRRLGFTNLKLLSILISGTPNTIYGAKRDKKLAPRYIKNISYYLNCGYEYLTNEECTSIGKPKTLPYIPDNFKNINNTVIVNKANILRISPAILGTKCKIGSINGSRICNGTIKFLPIEVIEILAGVLKCTTSEILSPAYLSNTSTKEENISENKQEHKESHHDNISTDILGNITLKDIVEISKDEKLIKTLLRLHKLNSSDKELILNSIEPMLERFEKEND